ncbi:NAD(P)-dependent oxidoreductase [Segnochrobactrum spirostomi]|uniref:dihydrouracil dehydrogenase (NAD(+)) n=1 Tax=Segnochrobactrum spirostomi TaxID=2608987 RepID=A0A6A7Y4Z6_9HYPH|nr:NAD(P)-dependent oxidoreductase [Segnochrobactrum spirostomi]MQT14243.1 NAD(P)-dependent oxidoreductase [Segnochrobactrum spirostomi]
MMTDVDIRAGRLPSDDLARNFSDLHPVLTDHEAAVEAGRCLFCYDAPCMQACPTSIDVPLFIRQISTGNRVGAARTILDANALGAMCARVCPTETLCEEACVRNAGESKPIEIGRLQRYATDAVVPTGRQIFRRAAPTGRRVAVVGAGPAGLSCAHGLARAGHDVVIYDARPKAGGLNEYGIAAYKAAGGIAEQEVAWLLAIGGIEIRAGIALGRDVSLDALLADHDAVFLGMGLQGINALGLGGETAGVRDAVDFIADLRQAQADGRLDGVATGRRVIVIGGGMTAVDAAIQSKKLGADEVTIVYRRGAEAMNASVYEQELAQLNGVTIRHWARPAALESDQGRLVGVRFEETASRDGRLVDAGRSFRLEADLLLTAIGQTFVAAPLTGALELENGRIKVDEIRATSLPRVWAGGDCVAGGEDLTVVAVEDGKIAARAIDAAFAAASRVAAE